MSKNRVYDIKPIQTLYKKITFRSKLEAKWAVFFDYLKWEWLYEPNRFKFNNFTYLPDFYFPDLGIYAEVKPDKLTPKERSKCIELSTLFIDKPVVLLIGLPNFEVIKTILNGGNGHDVIPMPLNDKYYPFYYSSDFDASYFYFTSSAILEALTTDF